MHGVTEIRRKIEDHSSFSDRISELTLRGSGNAIL